MSEADIDQLVGDIAGLFAVLTTPREGITPSHVEIPSHLIWERARGTAAGLLAEWNISRKGDL